MKITNGTLTFEGTRKQVAIKAFRSAGFYGRLYWRRAHPHWRWDSDVIAKARHKGAGTDYLSVSAIWEDAGFWAVDE